MFTRILCPIDGSDHASKAFDLAVDLAKKYGAELHFIHALLTSADSKELGRFARIEGLGDSVSTEAKRLSALEGRLEFGYDDDPASPRILTEIGQKILDNAIEDAREQGVTASGAYLVNGDAAKQIIRCVGEHGIDCVVMGTRGLSDVRSLVLGSVSHKVANGVPCTCIAVK